MANNINDAIQFFAEYNIKYPEYEVITPQRKQSFTLRTLTAAEEEVLKGSILTPIEITQHLADVLWDCIIKKPDDIKTFDDFINKVTLRDRDCLVYGLFNATYKDTQSFIVTCSNPECQYKNKIKIDMEKGFNYQLWDKEIDCIDTKVNIPLEILKGVTCVLKVPVIADEIKLSKETLNVSSEDSQLMTDLLMIDHFKLPGSKNTSEKKESESETEDDNSKNLITERDKILEAYRALPSYDRKLINQKYYEEFDKYRISVKAEFTCRCGNKQEVRIDATRQFFQSLF